MIELTNQAPPQRQQERDFAEHGYFLARVVSVVPS